MDQRLAAGLSLVLLIVLSACGGTSAGTRSHGSPSGSTPAAQAFGVPTATSTPQTHPATDADNLRTAARESERTLRLAPLPPGAQRLRGRPSGWPSRLGIGLSPSDGSLTRTAWYAVPLSVDAVQGFLVGHPPHGMTGNRDPVGYGAGVRFYRYRALHPREPAAYTVPALLVQWSELGPRTIIRFGATSGPL